MSDTSSPPAAPAEPVWIGALANTPLGDIWLAARAQGLIAVAWKRSEAGFRVYLAPWIGTRPVLLAPAHISDYANAIRAYLAGEQRTFDLPIDWSILPEFQRQALQLVTQIPYGATCTYGDIARQLGQPNAARAVGRANATNPMPLVIPCHRVLGKDNHLHGYGYGLATKAWLLTLEGAPVGQQLRLL